MNNSLNYKLKVVGNKFNNIFIVENRNYWDQCKNICNVHDDLILTVDFGLKHYLSKKGYKIEFLDHLVEKTILDPLNHKLHFFLNNWFKNQNGEDLLSYKNFNLGDSLLLFTTNDIAFFAHYFFNILGIKQINHKKIFVLSNNQIVIDCLQKANIDFSIIAVNVKNQKFPEYNFPLNNWIEEKTAKKSIRFRFKSLVASFFDFLNEKIDVIINDNKLENVYVQKYYPTENIISKLSSDNQIRVIQQNYSSLYNVFNERRLSFKTKKSEKKLISELINSFLENKNLEWNYLSIDISNILFNRIEVILNNIWMKQ